MIIGIAGKAGSGKSTVKNHLIDHYNFRPVAFADELKIYAIEYFGLTPEEVYIKKTEQSRKILQGIGLMFRERVDKEYWIKKTIEKILSINLSANYVIDDVRFENEIQAIRDAFSKSKVIKLIRIPEYKVEYGGNHPSETEIDSISDEMFDAIITAEEGDLEGLKKQAIKAFGL